MGVWGFIKSSRGQLVESEAAAGGLEGDRGQEPVSPEPICPNQAPAGVPRYTVQYQGDLDRLTGVV